MTHLMLTSALLFALLAVVAIAIGASLGIAEAHIRRTLTVLFVGIFWSIVGTFHGSQG